MGVMITAPSSHIAISMEPSKVEMRDHAGGKAISGYLQAEVHSPRMGIENLRFEGVVSMERGSPVLSEFQLIPKRDNRYNLYLCGILTGEIDELKALFHKILSQPAAISKLQGD
jgi:hypothetical protein